MATTGVVGGDLVKLSMSVMIFPIIKSLHPHISLIESRLSAKKSSSLQRALDPPSTEGTESSTLFHLPECTHGLATFNNSISRLSFEILCTALIWSAKNLLYSPAGGYLCNLKCVH